MDFVPYPFRMLIGFLIAAGLFFAMVDFVLEFMNYMGLISIGLGAFLCIAFPLYYTYRHMKKEENSEVS